MSDVKKLQKGDEGESIVSRELRRLQKGVYFVLNDFCFKHEVQGVLYTTQVDHIVFSKFGIFVIETKNYSGALSIDIDSSEWLYQSVSEKTGKLSKKIQSFQNPYKQNEYHINFLSRLLEIEKSKFANMVVFVDKNLTLEEGMEDYILWYDEVIPYIRLANKERFKLEELEVKMGILSSHICSREVHLQNLARLKKWGK